MSIKSIKTESTIQRLLLALAVLISLVLVFFVAKWFFGNSISTQADTKEVAELAVSMASSDPQTHYSLAVLREKSFLPEDLPKSLAEYEKATALSPNDFRLWLSLGKARERNGDTAGAERALQKSIELAPNYAEVQWAYGNVLLRQGKTDAAFKEIRKAVDNDPKFANPAATAVWQIFEGDVEKIKGIIGNSHHVNAALSTSLARQKRFDEALEMWKTLPEKDKKETFKDAGKQIFGQLVTAKKYRAALQINEQIAQSDAEKFKVGTITNGGFESNINVEKPSIFEWKLAKGTKPKINISTNQKNNGKRSLVFTFKTTKREEFRPVSQVVAVESGQSYAFKVFYKSELETDATMKWEIVDTSTNKILASTSSISATTDWESLNASFTTSETTEGIIIRLTRTGCNSVVCPISGKVWFDDFSIE